jgi:hypothetical protein
MWEGTVWLEDDTSYVAESVSMSTWNKNETPNEPILRADTGFHMLVGILSAKYVFWGTAHSKHLVC